jgi:sialate O-acetylesterase
LRTAYAHSTTFTGRRFFEVFTMDKPVNSFFLMLLLVLSPATSLHATELSINRYFTDNMVLQRDKPLVIRGSADQGATVTVTFAGQSKSAKADDRGVWEVTLAPLAATKTPQPLSVSSDGDNVTLNNVVVGDVILHARQTSVDISLGRDEAGRQAASAHKNDPMFRAIAIKAIPSATPLDDLAADATTGWRVVDKDTALKMTASAYYLGRELIKNSDVPIGIIDINMGPAFANGWLSREALLETGKFFNDREVAGQVEKYEKLLEAELKGEKLRAKDDGPPKDTLDHPLFPAGGYNGTLHPLAGTALKAAVVQLGNDYPYVRYQEIFDSENPTDRQALSDAYGFVYDIRKVGFRMESKVVPRVTREWRKVLGDEDVPFGLIVPPGSDLNTFAKHHREMRELQRWAAQDNANVSVILPGSEHVPLSAQPADEALLGNRIRLWMEGAVYRKPDVPATGPWFDRFEANYNQATIYFKEGTAEGLKANGDALDYFEAANVEGDYHPVEAVIDGQTIRLKSDTVTRIMRVRYNLTDRPNQGLVNAAGLPAIPFRTARDEYEWFFRNEETDLPEEYSLPANEWKKNDVTLINANLENYGYTNFAGWFGPTGFRGGPFGPNIGVAEIKKDSPADGKLRFGDVIYSANGKMVGQKSWLVMAEAITKSETREAGGKLVLGVRRGAENIEVELTLPVMGTYSSTSPYDCPKTEKIVANLENWLATTGGSDTGRTGADFLGTDSLFLLGTGNPKYLGLVRRAIYQKLASTQIVDEIDPTKGPKAWFPAWDALLLGEYYMATGDRNVLPLLKFNCDLLAAKQHEAGAWRHNYPGGDNYGLMPALGMAAAIGFHLANDAGLDISQEAYRRVVKYYQDQAAMGRVIYGIRVSSAAPPELEPEQMQNGKMKTYNGAVASAGILFNLEGDTRVAHLCSTISAHAWNNTFEGHGGNFWNNFWTPLGAKVQGKDSFINFWKNYRWYRECARMPDGSLIGGGKPGAGYGLALVSPRQRLQITGAPASPFQADAPELIKPALEAYGKRDYALAEKLANELLASGNVELRDQPTVEYLARAAKDMQESFDADFARMQKLIGAGELYEAKTFLAGLEGVVAANDKRLIAMRTKLANVSRPPSKKERTVAVEPTEKPRQWEVLVIDRQFKDPTRIQRERNGPIVTTKRKKPNLWRMKVIEDMKHAPEHWFETTFDDSHWLETEMPISWRMYHTALFRTTFNVEDRSRFDGLRLYAWVLRQQDMQIYLNGELIGKVSNVGKLTTLEHPFKQSALKHLKTGQNTLAITTRHNWRWGRSFMRVYNDGFDFNLDARLKETAVAE